MALHTFGTNANNSLTAIAWGPSPPAGQAAGTGQLAPSDLQPISCAITGDKFSAANQTLGITTAVGILCTGTTHGNTTLDTLVSTGGAPLAAIGIGWGVLAVGITPATIVTAINSSTSVTLSAAASTSAANTRIIFVPPDVLLPDIDIQGFLRLPGGRGVIKLLPGDIVALDNTGWPIVVSASSRNYVGSVWTFT